MHGLSCSDFPIPFLQAILFLQQLLDFQETAGAMLASQGIDVLPMPAPPLA